VDRTVIDAATSSIPINVEGGRVRMIRSALPARSRAVRPGVLEA
jgi:hypothetical protein